MPEEVDLKALRRRVEEASIWAGSPGLKAAILTALERAERVEKAAREVLANRRDLEARSRLRAALEAEPDAR